MCGQSRSPQLTAKQVISWTCLRPAFFHDASLFIKPASIPSKSALTDKKEEQAESEQNAAGKPDDIERR